MAFAPILLRGSVYPTQQPLTKETALPVMQKGIDEISQNRFSVVVLIPTSNLKYRTKYLIWSNDADDSLFKTNNRANTPENTCSFVFETRPTSDR
jgi:hypothetical protein